MVSSFIFVTLCSGRDGPGDHVSLAKTEPGISNNYIHSTPKAPKAPPDSVGALPDSYGAPPGSTGASPDYTGLR